MLQSKAQWRAVGWKERAGSQEIREFVVSCSPLGFPWWFSRKEPACNAGDAGDAGSIPGSGGSPGGGHGYPLQDSCLENPMDRGAWQAIVHRVAKSQAQLKQLSTHSRSALKNTHFRGDRLL